MDTLLTRMADFQQRWDWPLRTGDPDRERRRAVADHLTAQISEGRSILDAARSPSAGILALARNLGFVDGVRASWRLAYRSPHLASSLESLRRRRTDLGLELGEANYISAALVELLRLFPEPKNVVARDRSVWVEAGAPWDSIPRHTVRTTAKGKTISKPRPEREVQQEYKDCVAEAARSLASRALTKIPGLDTLYISLVQTMLDPLTGHEFMGCVLSVQIDRATFEGILHDRVQPENALKNFPLRFSYDQGFRLRPVQPFSPPSQALTALLGASAGSDLSLDTIDPLEFEELIRRLLEKMGYEATLTKASHDGGIDVVAFNPQPIVGGKLVVQCKRYSNVIGSPVVRDLYGAVVDSRASKGILITTSYFSPDATKFAEGKPLELIGREQLEALLRQHALHV